MYSKFLIGGGWDSDGCALTYGPFLKAATKSTRKILVIAASAEKEGETSLRDHCAVFEKLGVSSSEIAPLVVTPANPLTIEMVETVKPTGLFVCGGTTPIYQEALCVTRDWLDYLEQEQVPYAGFSAGSAIAAPSAIVGGWQVEIDGKAVAMLDNELAEDLDKLEVRPGLGMFPHAVDVHASQWGTLTRLIHAVDQGMVSEGFAIDENTMLAVVNKNVTVCGLGHVYHVERTGEGEVKVSMYRAGREWSLR